MSDMFPVSREIVFCELNPILADQLLHVFRSDDWLSARFSFRRVRDLAEALNSLTINILVLDPSQDDYIHNKWENVIADFPRGIALIGYGNMRDAADARALMSKGFRAVVPKTVESEELLRIVSAVSVSGTYSHAIYKENPVPARSIVTTAGMSALLTDRECEVLRQVALGCSLKEIAACLNISIKTVDTYKTRANRKLDLRTRSDIVRYAIQSGWMQDQPAPRM